MHKRIIRWLSSAALALALIAGLVAGNARPLVAHGAEPTPTPTPLETNSQPGGHGGGGG